MDTIGSRVREARKMLQLSQEALARRAEISLSQLNQLERGVITDPRYSTLIRLARALGQPIGTLVGETEPIAPKEVAPPELVEELARRRDQDLDLQEELDALSANDRFALERLLQSFSVPTMLGLVRHSIGRGDYKDYPASPPHPRYQDIVDRTATDEGGEETG